MNDFLCWLLHKVFAPKYIAYRIFRTTKDIWGTEYEGIYCAKCKVIRNAKEKIKREE